MNKTKRIKMILLGCMASVFVRAQAPGSVAGSGFDRMIPSRHIEVCFEKTVHIIFPTMVKYIDLGSPNLIADKAGTAENVVRVKAAVRGFTQETNFSVICEDGSFYSFDVCYAENPQKLSLEMKDFIHDANRASDANQPGNEREVYLSELGQESPLLVRMVMQSIHSQNKRHVKHIGSQKFGIKLSVKGIYVHSNIIYLHLQTVNYSNVAFDVDFIRFKVVDKKRARRTAIQETQIEPVRAFQNEMRIDGKQVQRTVFAFNKFTIPNDKRLVIELFELQGGRHQSVSIENADLIKARQIKDLTINK